MHPFEPFSSAETVPALHRGWDIDYFLKSFDR